MVIIRKRSASRTSCVMYSTAYGCLFLRIAFLYPLIPHIPVAVAHGDFFLRNRYFMTGALLYGSCIDKIGAVNTLKLFFGQQGEQVFHGHVRKINLPAGNKTQIVFSRFNILNIGMRQFNDVFSRLDQ